MKEQISIIIHIHIPYQYIQFHINNNTIYIHKSDKLPLNNPTTIHIITTTINQQQKQYSP